MGAVPLPSAKNMKADLTDLTSRKETMCAEYTFVQNEAKEYETIKQNVDALLLSSQKDFAVNREHLL